MGKVNCKCGNQISNVASPSSNNGWLISDIGLDEMEEEMIDPSYIISVGIDVWECGDCGAVAFGNHKDRGIIWYYPEEKPPQSLMERATHEPK